MIKKIINEFTNKKILILGFGLEGKATYHFLRRYLPNIPLYIADQNTKIIDELKDDPYVQFITGQAYLDHLDKYDLIMKSPGITLKDIDTSSFRHKISSQLQIILKYYHHKIIGITGTKGKSTTSSLLYNMLQQNNKKTLLLGNIGKPLFNYIEDFNKQDYLVIESSCDQLEFVTYSPHIAIITNFYEDHLDHLNSLENYYKAKLNITKYQESNDYLIYYDGSINLQNAIKKLPIKAHIIKIGYDQQLDLYSQDGYIISNNQKIYNLSEERKLIGDHNTINIMLCLACGLLLNLDLAQMKLAINTFTPLEHRLEKVGTYNDITYYNDAIATIPYATISGIEALKKVNTLIFGGLDRHINYDEFITYLNNCSIENLICMPSTGHKIGKQIKNKKVYFVETLEEAVKLAKQVTKKNTICLMSPAAASYEYFKNFEEKGKKYKELVKEN